MKTDKTMSLEMGGEIEQFIKKWEGTLIRCFGTCNEDRIMGDFKGYEHDGGLSDASGKKWWVYYECQQCRYGHSFAKMRFFKDNTTIEQNVEYK